MYDEVRSGKVLNYASKGSPVVKCLGRIAMIHGYQTAYKTPIGDVAEFVVTDKSKPRYDIGKIINDKPSDIFGTISMFSDKGLPLMDRDRRIIFVDGYTTTPDLGSVIEYRRVIRKPNFEAVWVVEDDALEKTINILIARSDSLFRNAQDKKIFSDIMKKIGDNYVHEYHDMASTSIDKLHGILGNRLFETKDPDKDIYGILNGLKFIKLMIAEQCSKIGAYHSK